MSSVVCQGLRSCLKPRLIEPIVLRHKLTPPISITIPLPQQLHPEEKSYETNHVVNEEDDNKNKVKKNDDLGGWSFLTNPSQFGKQVSEKTEKPYVHPMVKSFSSTLSSKSLEMCTESLGCETGSDICESNDMCSLMNMQRSRIGRQLSKKVVATSSSFPPPLTSISGSDGVRVKPHREGGRLVIKAVSVSSCGPNFQAERTNGRLKLSLVKNCSMKCQFQMEEKDEEQEAYFHEETNIDNNIVYNDDNADDNDEDEDEDENENEDEDEDEEEEEICSVRDIEGNVRNAEGRMGMDKISRLSRCKEGRIRNKDVSNWGSFWVAIS